MQLENESCSLRTHTDHQTHLINLCFTKLNIMLKELFSANIEESFSTVNIHVLVILDFMRTTDLRLSYVYNEHINFICVD